jgi:phage FluMu protein Com
MSRTVLAGSEASGSRDVRCHCGSLVARITDGKVEIKCRRCQRIGLIDLTRQGSEGEPVDVQWLSGGTRTKSK